MTPAEAFALIPLAAVRADHVLNPEEAHLLQTQLRQRSPYRDMDPAAFGLMISNLLLGLRDHQEAMLREAAVLLSPEQQQTAFALAARLVHGDRIVTAEEAAVLSQLAETLSVAPATLRQIEASFALVSRDCLA